MGLVVNFDWTPKSVAVSYTVGGNTYPYSTQADAISRPTTDANYQAFTTPTNTLLTFTATVIVPSDRIITEYKWLFGDGSIGYGATATHTYLAAASQTMATLAVTDSKGTRTIRSQILNLRTGAIVLVAHGARVGP